MSLKLRKKRWANWARALARRREQEGATAHAHKQRRLSSPTNGAADQSTLHLQSNRFGKIPIHSCSCWQWVQITKPQFISNPSWYCVVFRATKECYKKYQSLEICKKCRYQSWISGSGNQSLVMCRQENIRKHQKMLALYFTKSKHDKTRSERYNFGGHIYCYCLDDALPCYHVWIELFSHWQWETK